MICVAGSTVMVIHAPEEEKVSTVVEMAAKMKDTGRLRELLSRKALGRDGSRGRSSWVLTMPDAVTWRRRKLKKES